MVSTMHSHFSSRKNAVHIVQEPGWASGLVWTGNEKYHPNRFDPQTHQHTYGNALQNEGMW